MRPVITSEDLRRACLKPEFRALFPGLKDKFEKWIQKPGCASCARSLFEELASQENVLADYFGDVDFDIVTPEGSASAPPISYVQVINCSVHDLEDELSKLPTGPKQIAAARYEDQITVIVNMLE